MREKCHIRLFKRSRLRNFSLGADAFVRTSCPDGIVKIDVATIVLDALDDVVLNFVLRRGFLVCVLVVEQPGDFHLRINIIINECHQ
jgi:hypothetical protein